MHNRALPMLASMFFIVLAFPNIASAQNIDCSVIKDNPPSLKKCQDGQDEARRWQKEKEAQQLKEQRIKEGLDDARRLFLKCLSKNKINCGKEALRPKKAE